MTLTLLIWLPFACALLAALLPQAVSPRIVLLGSLATLAVAVAVFTGFDHSKSGLQYLVDEPWINSLGISYKLGVDGLNVLLILLTAILFAAAIFAANLRKWERPKLFYFNFALAQSAVMGAFCAQDLILFVVFFDLMLIPFYFLTGIWGGENRIAATLKFVIYTLVGSLFMLVAAIATGIISAQKSGVLSFDFTDLSQSLVSTGSQRWIFLFFTAAFLIKMPAFPLHGWMPDGYRAMPLVVLAVFAAILSKVAAYGFLRIALPLYPQAAVDFQMLLIVIALASILYGSIVAFSQTNLRLILGFSSIAQLGFITLGIFSLQFDGAQGALFQMVNHGLVVTPIFIVIAVIADRAKGSEDLRDLGGVALRAPVLAVLFLILSLGTLAMPGSANFVGEFLILFGAFKESIAISAIASIGVVLASVYALRAFIRTMHNRTGAEVTSREIDLGNALAVIPVIGVIIALALYPQVALKKSQLSVANSILRPAGIKEIDKFAKSKPAGEVSLQRKREKS